MPRSVETPPSDPSSSMEIEDSSQSSTDASVVTNSPR